MDNPPKLHKIIKWQSVIFAVLLGMRVLLAGFFLFPGKGLPAALAALCAAFLMRYLCANIWATKGMISMQFMVSLIVSDLVCFLIWICAGRPAAGLFLSLWMSGAAAVLATGLFFLYGLINERNVVRHSLEITSPKLQREYRIAVLSDIHFATIQKESALRSVVQRINAEAPDAVLLAGDIAEENTPGEKLPELFVLLGKLESSYGTFFVHGNHDRQEKLSPEERTYSDEEFNRLMRKAGIVCLDDERKELNDDILLIGREDYSVEDRKNVSQLLSQRDPNRFAIVMEHQPTDCSEIAGAGVELCLAGHYHGAQNWTNNIVYRLSDIPYDGYYQKGKMILYVNAGIAGSKYPIRTHSHNEYLMVYLHKE